MKKPVVIGLIVLLVVLGVVAAIILLRPTPETPNTEINVIGGKVTFEDPEIVRILDEKYNITVNVLTNSGLNKFKQNGVVDYAGVDAIMGGSASFADELQELYPDGLPNSTGDPIRDYKWTTVAQSPLALHVKTENGDIAAFVKAGVFTQHGSSYTVSGEKLLTIIDCETENGDWSTIGVNIPGKCRFGFTNPSQSSGGRYALSYLASCLTNLENPCSTTVTVEQLNSVLPVLLHAFDVSGKKSGDNDSVQFYYDWANSSNPAERVMFAYESAPISWLNSSNVPEAYRDQASKSIAIVYPEFTFMSTQQGIYLTDNGKMLIEAMTTDPDLIAAMNSRIGFRAGYGGSLPQALPSVSQDQSLFTVIPDPRADVTSALVEAICTNWPENPGCKK